MGELSWVPAFGPLEVQPRGFRWPLEESSAPVLRRGDRWPAPEVTRAERVQALCEPLAGVELGEYDRVILEWLAGWDDPTVGVVVSLLHRARALPREGSGRHRRQS